MRSPLPTDLRWIVTAAALVVLVAGLRAAEAILVPCLVALFLAMLSLPLMRWFERRGLRTGLAVAFTLLVVCAVLGFLGYLLSLSLSGVANRAPQYQELFQQHARAALDWLQARGIEADTRVMAESVGTLVNLVTGTFLGVASLLTALFLVLLTTVFLLLETRGFESKLESAVEERSEALRRYSKITADIQRYVVVKTMVSVATGVTVGVWVGLAGLDFPLLWGFLAFLLNYIPNIGSILAALPATGLAFLQLSVPRALLVLLGYVVINLVWGNLVEPQVLGHRLRLSSLAVFLSLVFWGWVWGPLGMILSVPITMMLKILMENSPSLRWLAKLLEQAPPRTKVS